MKLTRWEVTVLSVSIPLGVLLFVLGALEITPLWTVGVGIGTAVGPFGPILLKRMRQ